MDNKQAVYDEMLRLVRQIARDHATNRVFPHDLLPWLPFQCSVWTVRRYMRRMTDKGLLIRHSRRGGYCAAIGIPHNFNFAAA